MEYINIRKLCIMLVVLLYCELLLQLQMHFYSTNHTKFTTLRRDVNISFGYIRTIPKMCQIVIKVVTYYIHITSCHVSVYCKAFLIKGLSSDFRFL